MMKKNPISQIMSVLLFIGLIAVPSIPVFGDTTKVACVGDSITWGWGLSNRNHESYPAVLQTLLGSQYIVTNCGTSGCTMLKRGDMPYWNDANFGASTEVKPDIVVIMLGSNDAKPQNWSHKSDFITDYHSMIEHYRGLGARVYIASPPPVYHGGRFGITPAVVNDQIVPLVRQVAANANVKLIDVFTALSGKPGYFPDTVHPNADGSRLIAQTVAASLTSNPVIQTSTPAATQTSTTPRTVIAVNCGGGSFTSSDGIEYAADTAYSGGSTYSSDAAISGTTDDALYQSERYGNATYSITVPNGHYRVTLHFAETYHAEAGLRRFDVVMEGTQCISGLDIYAKAGGNAAYTTETNVNVGDGELNIEFVPSVENPKISAIKVVLDGPGASFIAVPDMPVQGQTITFDASASNNPKGTITAYSWDFGDGGKATGVTASHSYSTAGEHTVTLKVTGSGGDTGNLAKTVKVYTGEPIADCLISPTRSKPGDTVTVDASASFDIDGTIAGYVVDYGDGTKGNGAVTTHKYATEGDYTITLTVTDNDGRTGSISRSVRVREKQRYRVIMSSDFPPFPVTNSDPDDVQSMVRFLLYSNEFDVEGLIAAAGTFRMVAEKRNILAVLDEYDKVDESLRKHDPDYPTADALRAVTFEGLGNNHNIRIQWGCGKQSPNDIIGEGRDSEASNAIIAAADKPDPRPLWIGVWGGPREVAQAIWRVRNDRSEEEADAFISKLRVFLIACQDGTHGYLMSIPELFVIESRRTYGSFFCGGGENCNLAWAKANILQNHGPLCAIYPPLAGVREGDTPSFMHLVSANRGINDPENPAEPGWGGQYRRDGNTNHWLDGSGDSIRAGRDMYQAEFAERADWCVE